MQEEIELPPGARRKPVGVKAKRTARQRFMISVGYHPLSPVVPGRVLRLAPGASRDRTGPGPRCGGCAFYGPLDTFDGRPFGPERKCWFNRGERVTRGAATEVRAWWPACQNFQADTGADPGASAG